jgi:uncharacterized iron-regulated membrane protein
MGAWQRWVQRPQTLWLHKLFFQIHYSVGAIISFFVLLMSVSGSIIVYRDELSRRFSIEWLVNLHTNLLSGSTGRFVDGIGGFCVTLLCLTGAVIWWPGIKNWRRSLSVNWRVGLAGFSWDLHSAIGFWSFLLILMWGVSGTYFAFPQLFNAVSALLDPRDRFSDRVLFWLSQVHFGRFGWFSKALWSVLGLVPAVLAVTGVFICCRRMIYKKSANPHRQTVS